MSKITITRNCANGEHTFIPGNTYIDGREHIVVSWVCQHCLWLVNCAEWEAHQRINFDDSLKGTMAVCSELITNKMPEEKWPEITPYKYEKPKETKQSYPGKRRGPKPKQMNLTEAHK